MHELGALMEGCYFFVSANKCNEVSEAERVGVKNTQYMWFTKGGGKSNRSKSNRMYFQKSNWFGNKFSSPIRISFTSHIRHMNLSCHILFLVDVFCEATGRLP